MLQNFPSGGLRSIANCGNSDAFISFKDRSSTLYPIWNQWTILGGEPGKLLAFRNLPLVAVSSVSCSERLAPWMIGFTKGHSFTIVMRWANLFSTLEILDFYSSVTKSALILIMSMAAPFEIFSCELSVMPMKVNSFCQISRVYLSVTRVYTIYQHSAQEVRSRRRRYPEVPKRNFSMCVAHKGDANGD